MESVLSLKIMLGFFFRKKALFYQYHLWRGSLQPFFSRIINVAANFVLFWCKNSESAPHPEPAPPPHPSKPEAALFISVKFSTDVGVRPTCFTSRVVVTRFTANKTPSFPLRASRDTCTRTSALWRALESFSEAEAFGVRQQRSACVALKDISVM